MIEQQIQIKIPVANRHAFLPCHETKVAAQLKKKSFEFFENGAFKILLTVGVS